MNQIQEILNSIFSIDPSLKRVILEMWEKNSDEENSKLIEYLKKIQKEEVHILGKCIKNNPDFVSKLKNIQNKYKREAILGFEEGDASAEKKHNEELLKQL